jgi:hypothetical protein
VALSQNKKTRMKANDKNSLDSKKVNSRIAEIRESIEQIKIQLSESRKLDNSMPKLYAVAAEIHYTERSPERFEIQLMTLREVFE